MFLYENLAASTRSPKSALWSRACFEHHFWRTIGDQITSLAGYQSTSMQRLLCTLTLAGMLAAASGRAAADSFVRVDARIELMTVVQLLSGYPTLTTVDSTYRRDVTHYFQGFKDHRAVRLFAEASRANFAYDAVPRAILCFSAPPELKPIAQPDGKVLRRAGGPAKLDEFIAALRDFCAATDFVGFFKAHEDDYARVVATLQPDVIAAVNALGNYTGIPFTNCELIAGMLIHNGGFQATVQAGAVPTIYAIIGAVGVSQGLPVFTANGSVSHLVQHEFSHSFVNPFVENNTAAVSRHARLLDAIKPQMAKLAYADWATAVHEHIVRAIVARLADLRDPQSGNRVLANEERKGFRYIRALAERLKDYEAARDKYPTLPSFLPQLLATFERVEP